MNDSLFDEITQVCSIDDDQLNEVLNISEHADKHAIIQSINQHVARLLSIHPPLEITDSDDDDSPTNRSVNQSVDLLTRAMLAESRLAERDDEYHRVQGRMRDLQLALVSLTSENEKLNEQLTSTPIISQSINQSLINQSINRSQRPSLTAALTSIEQRHADHIAELNLKHAQELEHTLQYKYLFAQLASRKEDLELALELEKHKTRKTRSLIEKCIKVTEQFEAQEQRLAGTVARLAHQLIEAGIPIKGPILSSSTAINQSTNHSISPENDVISGIEVFSEADRSLMAELFAPSVRATPTVRSPTSSPPRSPRIPNLPIVPSHVLTMPSSMTPLRSSSSDSRPDVSAISSDSMLGVNRNNFQPSTTNQSTAKWMSWPKGWSRKGGPQPHG